MEHEVFVPVPVDRLREVLADPERVARAVPGLQQDAGTPPVAGRLKVRIAGHTITYRGSLHITAADDGTYAIEADATESRGSGSARLALTLRLIPATEGTTLAFHGTTKAEGRLTELPEDAVSGAGERLLGKFAESLGERSMAENAEAEAEAGAVGGTEAEAEAGRTSASVGGEAGEPGRKTEATGADAEAVGEAGVGRTGTGDDTPEAGGADATSAAPGSAGVGGDEAVAGGAGAAGGDEVPEAGDAGARGEGPGPGSADGASADRPASGGAGGVGRGEAVAGSPDPGPGDDEEAAPRFDAEVPPSSLDPFAEDDFVVGGEPPAEAAHARRTMIGRSAEEVDHAPPRGRYAPVPASETVSAGMALRWAAPAAALVLASAIIVGRALRRRR